MAQPQLTLHMFCLVFRYSDQLGVRLVLRFTVLEVPFVCLIESLADLLLALNMSLNGHLEPRALVAIQLISLVVASPEVYDGRPILFYNVNIVL
jgi:hypothetical protein